MDTGTPLSLASDDPLVDFDGICQKVRAALEPVRTHAVSLHDEQGDLLWLSESAMGPDEHNAVRDALDGFANERSPAVLAFDLGDCRSAVALRTINARRQMVGLVMVIVDTRTITQDDRGVARLVSPKLQRALMDFACMLPDRVAEVKTPQPPSPVAEQPAVPTRSPNSAPAPEATPAKAKAKENATQASRSQPRATSRPAPALKTPTPPNARNSSVSKAPAVAPEIDRLNSALRRSPIALHVQRLMPLITGDQAKRYEVLLRSTTETMPSAAPQAMLKAAVEAGLGSMLDRRVVTALIGWLVRNRGAWEKDSALFTVNLTSTALHDEHFLKFVELCLVKSALPAGTIGFEFDVPAALKPGIDIGAIATALHRLRCPLVLDNFALRTECIDLLRLPGVKFIKLAPAVTSRMRIDKLAQAAITAMVQMARVLGMQTVAKHVNSAKEHQWLTAFGVDFIQSNTVAPPAAIESLAAGQVAAR